MKKMYFVCARPTEQCPRGEIVKKFRHLPEAEAFMANDNHQQQYHGLTLYCRTGADQWFLRRADGLWIED